MKSKLTLERGKRIIKSKGKYIEKLSKSSNCWCKRSKKENFLKI